MISFTKASNYCHQDNPEPIDIGQNHEAQSITHGFASSQSNIVCKTKPIVTEQILMVRSVSFLWVSWSNGYDCGF